MSEHATNVYGLGATSAALDHVKGAAVQAERAASIEAVMAAAFAARKRAEAVLDSAEIGTFTFLNPLLWLGTMLTRPTESVLQAWRGNVKKAKEIFVLLTSTKQRAVEDIVYTPKWLETAKALTSQLDFIVTDEKGQGFLNNLRDTIAETYKTIKEGIKDALSWGALGAGIALVVLLWWKMKDR